jgi:ribonuclease-3
MNDFERIAELERRLRSQLPNRERAIVALTHRSSSAERANRGDVVEDNERLEFLGDAALDLVVSQRLMEANPDLREGDLSKRRAAVVNEGTLAAVARAMGLGELLMLGRGEELSGGREKPSVLADALEAVVAALYLDHGMAGVLGFVDVFLSEPLAQVAAGMLGHDYKTRLQELVQGQKLGTLRYQVMAETGPDHVRVFEVEVQLSGAPLGRGTGSNKKEAEQAAAKVAIDALSVGKAP